MKVIEYQEELLPELTKMVNFHIRNIPPFIELTESQVEDVLENAGEWWCNIKRPYKQLNKNISCVIEDGKLIAAIEWAQYESFDIDYPISREDCCINWVFTYPENKRCLQLLIDHIGIVSKKIGCKQLRIPFRFHFGVGWMGIPESWDHIIDGLTDCGFSIRDYAMLMTRSTSSGFVHKNINLDYKIHHKKNEQTLELITECRLKNGELIGECWLGEMPPYITKHINRLRYWRYIEWIEVNENYRRAGIGTKLLQSQIDHFKDVDNIILMVDADEDDALQFYNKNDFKLEEKLYLFSDKVI